MHKREIPDEVKELAGADFVARAEEAAKRISRENALKWAESMADIEAKCVCSHCGRCVLAGPPCCYDSMYEAYQMLHKENMWYRKIQSRKDKRINQLEKELEILQNFVKGL